MKTIASDTSWLDRERERSSVIATFRHLPDKKNEIAEMLHVESFLGDYYEDDDSHKCRTCFTRSRYSQ